MAVINLLGDKKIKEVRNQRARLMGGIAESAQAGSAATQTGMPLSKSLHAFAQQACATAAPAPASSSGNTG